METLMNEDHINDWYKNYNERKATPRLTEAFVDCQSKLMIIDKDRKGRFTYASLEQIIKIENLKLDQFILKEQKILVVQ